MPLENGTLLNERYRIEGVLGKGGFGAVYLALDEHLGFQCAVKENLSLSPEAERQFRREAKLLASLRHPNLPRVTHHFILEGHQYLVMDFVEGEDLKQRLAREESLSESDVLRWTEQICNALNYLHRQDPPIIHRDIKPANIRINSSGDAILVDFGIAKATAVGQTTSRGARGVTPGFAPPEQYGLGHTDSRTDIYALGATIYRLLTSESPPDSVERLVGRERLIPVQNLRPDLAPNVAAAITKAMECRREDRFQSITEFANGLTDTSFRLELVEEEVEEFLAEQLIEDLPPTPIEKPRRRYWWLSLVGIMIFLIALGMVVLNSPDLIQALTSIRNAILAPPRVIVIRMTATPIPSSLLAGSVASVTQRQTSAPRATQAPSLTPTATPLPESITLDNARAWRLYSRWREGSPNIPLAMSPDGKTIAVYSGAGVDILDTKTGSVVNQLQYIAVDRTIIGLALNEVSVLVKYEDELIRYSLTTGNITERFKIPDRDMLISPDGSLIATRGEYVRIFSLATGELLSTRGGQYSEQKIAFSPDGRYFAITNKENVELWNTVSWKSQTFVGHGEPTEGLVFSDDGAHLISASGDIWEVEGGKRIGYFDSSTTKVALSPNKKVIVGADGSVWNYETGELIGRMPIESQDVHRIQFTPEGNFLVRHLSSGAIELWTPDSAIAAQIRSPTPYGWDSSDLEPIDVMNISRLINFGRIGEGSYRGLAISPDQSLMAGWTRNEVQIINLYSRNVIDRFQTSRTIEDGAFLGNQFFLVVNRLSGVERWDLNTLQMKQSYGVPGTTIAASPDGRMFAVREVYIQVVDAVSGEMKRRLGTKEVEQYFQFTPDSLSLVIASGSNVALWNVANGKLVRKFSVHGDQPVTSVSFTPDGQILVASSGDVWELEKGQRITTFETLASHIAVTQNGQLIVGDDGSLWNGMTGQFLGELAGRATHLAFAPTDDQLVWRDSSGVVQAMRIRAVPDHVRPQVSIVNSPSIEVITLENAAQTNLMGWWGRDNLLEIRYLRDGLAPRVRQYSNEHYKDFTLSPDGESITVLREEGIEMIDPFTGQVVDGYRIFMNPVSIHEIAYLGDHLLLFKERAGIERWNLETQTLVQRYDVSGHNLLVSPDFSHFAYREDNWVHLVHVEDGREVTPPIRISVVPQAYAFAPDGLSLAVVNGSVVEMREVSSGRRIGQLYGHTGTVVGLSFTPDGTRLIASSGDIWDASDLKKIAEFEGGGGGNIVHPQGGLFFEGNGAIRAVEDGRRIGTLLDLRGEATHLLLSLDGKCLLQMLADGRIYKWGVYAESVEETGLVSKNALSSTDVTNFQVQSHVGRGRLINVVWSYDDQFLAVNSTQNSIVYQAETMEKVIAFLDASVVGFASPNHVLVGGKQPLQLVQIGSGEVLESYGYRNITAAAYSPDHTWLAIGGQVVDDGPFDGLALINLEDGLFYPIHPGSGLFDEVTSLEFSSDSQYLAQSFHGAIYLWDVEGGVQVRLPITGNLSPASISPDGQYVAYFTKYQLRVEDLETGANRLPINADGQPFFRTGIDYPSYQPFDLAFQENGHLLVFYRNLNRRTFEVTVTTIEWNIPSVSGRVRIPRLIRLTGLDSLYTAEYENERPQRIPAFGLSPSETFIYGMTQDGVVHVFDAGGGRHIASSCSDYLDRMAISPDGEYVAMPDALGRIEIYEIASGQVIRTIDGTWFPVWMGYNSPSILMILQEDRTLSFIDTENGRTLLSLSDGRFEAGRDKDLSIDGRLLAILQLEAGMKQLFVFPLSPDGPLYDLGTFPVPYIPAFSPDGKTIATIHRNQVKLWDIQTREILLDDLSGMGTSIGSLTFTPDGLTLIASTGEIWELESQQMVSSFSNVAPRMEVRTNGEIILGQDGQVWDLASGEPVGIIPGLRESAIHFGFYDNGESFYWQSSGGIVEFWGREP